MRPRRLAAMLAALPLVFSLAGVVSAQDQTTVTSITIDRFARLSVVQGVIRVSGTVTCAATGEIHLEARGTQGDLTATDNLDLSPLACSTTPRTFTTSIESLDCSGNIDCFKPGRAFVEISYVSGQTPLVSRWVVVRPSNVGG